MFVLSLLVALFGRGEREEDANIVELFNADAKNCSTKILASLAIKDRLQGNRSCIRTVQIIYIIIAIIWASEKTSILHALQE
jgi:hypothetical protein